MDFIKAKKRRRTANFSPEEKLKFVRLLQQMGQPIISKVTSHDFSSNTEKEKAWREITDVHNSAGSIVRTTDNLKKLWGKLKSEAKTFRSQTRQAVSGTGGGPVTKHDDPVLELVIELTGRGSTGVMNVNDCDAEFDGLIEIGIEQVEDDFKQYIEEEKTREGEEPEFIIDFTEEKSSEYSDNINEERENTNENSNIIEKKEKEKNWINRRQPKITKNERTTLIKKQQETSNRFAAARLNAEKEKTNLIIQQKQQNAELHTIKMENEQLKNKLLRIYLMKQGAGSDIEDLEVLSNL